MAGQSPVAPEPSHDVGVNGACSQRAAVSRWVARTTLAEAVAEARSDVAYKTVITALGREKDHLTPLWLQRGAARLGRWWRGATSRPVRLTGSGAKCVGDVYSLTPAGESQRGGCGLPAASARSAASRAAAAPSDGASRRLGPLRCERRLFTAPSCEQVRAATRPTATATTRCAESAARAAGRAAARRVCATAATSSGPCDLSAGRASRQRDASLRQRGLRRRRPPHSLRVDEGASTRRLHAAVVGRRVPPQVPRAAAGRGARGQLVLPKLRQRRRLRPVLCLPRHAEVRRRRLPEMTRDHPRLLLDTPKFGGGVGKRRAALPSSLTHTRRGVGARRRSGSQVQGRARRDASASHAPRAPTCPAASHRAARRETARAAEARAAEARAATAQAQARSHPRPSCPSRRRATCRTSGRGPRRRECEPWQAAALFFIVSLLVSSAFLLF